MVGELQVTGRAHPSLDRFALLAMTDGAAISTRPTPLGDFFREKYFYFPEFMLQTRFRLIPSERPRPMTSPVSPVPAFVRPMRTAAQRE
jgi:hypothetical protein